jgi:hypothetical protein
VSFTIAPYEAFGKHIGKMSMIDLQNKERSPHSRWIESIKTSLDWIDAGNTLVCVGNHPLADFVTEVTPIGFTQMFAPSESLQGTIAREIGSRRGRPMIGSSAGGGIQISKMQLYGDSPEALLTKYNSTMKLDTSKKLWTEQEFASLAGLNHDKFRTPICMIVAKATKDGRNYSIEAYEQCIIQNISDVLQAGQVVIVSNFSMAYEQKSVIWGSEVSETITDGQGSVS